MKKIYIYHKGHEVIYFSTMKKMHKFLLYQLRPVHKTFAQFSKWLTQDFIYQLGMDEGQEYCTVSKVI